MLKPHTLGLTSHILKNTRSADQLKKQIYELETSSGCKVETSGEFSVSGVFDEKVIVCDHFNSDLKMELESAIQGPLMFLLSCSNFDSMVVTDYTGDDEEECLYDMGGVDDQSGNDSSDSDEYPPEPHVNDISQSTLSVDEFYVKREADTSSATSNEADTLVESDTGVSDSLASSYRSISTTEREGDITSPDPPETEPEYIDDSSSQEATVPTTEMEGLSLAGPSPLIANENHVIPMVSIPGLESDSESIPQAQLHQIMSAVQDSESSVEERITDEEAYYRRKHQEIIERVKLSAAQRRQNAMETKFDEDAEASTSSLTTYVTPDYGDRETVEREFEGTEYTESELEAIETAEREYVEEQARQYNLQLDEVSSKEYTTLNMQLTHEVIEYPESVSDSSSDSSEDSDCSTYVAEEDERDYDNDPMAIPIAFLTEAKLLLEQLGPWALYRFYQTNIRYLQRRTKQETRYNHIIGLELLMTALRKVYVLCDETMRVSGFSRDFVTTKVARLMDVLREYKPEVKQRNPDR